MSTETTTTTTPTARPIIRLKPKCGGRFFAGAPWVYGNELVLDRRTKGLKPGSICTLTDDQRVPVATVAFNGDSQIAARVLSRDPNVQIDAAWWQARLQAALSLRQKLFVEPFYRLVHAESDGLPGLVIDRFDETLVVQPNTAWAEAHRPAIGAALHRLLSPARIIWSGGSRARLLEGLSQDHALEGAALNGPLPVRMNGATYLADPIEGQKTGLFLDQRLNHGFAAQLARGGSLLDVFSHVGGFSLAGLVAGATQALAVDGSQAALDLATRGAAASGVADRFGIRRGDAFDVMRQLAEQGTAFDMVVCDPPAFAPSRQTLEAGLRGYEKTARAGLRLVRPGGFFVLCSCSHAVDSTALRQVAASALHRLGLTASLIHQGGAGPDHPIHPALPETGYLKALFFRLDPA